MADREQKKNDCSVYLNVFEFGFDMDGRDDVRRVPGLRHTASWHRFQDYGYHDSLNDVFRK